MIQFIASSAYNSFFYERLSAMFCCSGASFDSWKLIPLLGGVAPWNLLVFLSASVRVSLLLAILPTRCACNAGRQERGVSSTLPRVIAFLLGKLAVPYTLSLDAQSELVGNDTRLS